MYIFELSSENPSKYFCLQHVGQSSLASCSEKNAVKTHLYWPLVGYIDLEGWCVLSQPNGHSLSILNNGGDLNIFRLKILNYWFPHIIKTLKGSRHRTDFWRKAIIPVYILWQFSFTRFSSPKHLFVCLFFKEKLIKNLWKLFSYFKDFLFYYFFKHLQCIKAR